jgi:hypothetical protein
MPGNTFVYPQVTAAFYGGFDSRQLHMSVDDFRLNVCLVPQHPLSATERTVLARSERAGAHTRRPPLCLEGWRQSLIGGSTTVVSGRQRRQR